MIYSLPPSILISSESIPISISSEGGKVVVLSSWERMLQYAASALSAEGWTVATLTGKGTAEGKEENDRQQEKFKKDKSECEL